MPFLVKEWSVYCRRDDVKELFISCVCSSSFSLISSLSMPIMSAGASCSSSESFSSSTQLIEGQSVVQGFQEEPTCTQRVQSDESTWARSSSHKSQAREASDQPKKRVPQFPRYGTFVEMSHYGQNGNIIPIQLICYCLI